MTLLIYSAAFIGPCNALGVGELEDTIRPCSLTIGSERLKKIYKNITSNTLV